MSTFLVHKATPISLEDGKNFFWVAGGANGDVIGVKVRNTTKGFVEVHVLDGSEGYKSFSLQTETPITVADAPNFRWIGGDGDVIGVKVDNTDSKKGKVEVHFLDGSDDYHSFSRQKTTAIDVHDSHNFFWVKGGPNGDVIGVKVVNTDSKMVEVHVLDGTEDYQSFSLQKATTIDEGFGHYAYKWTGHAGDVVAVQWTGTTSKNAEVYVLDDAAEYHSFSGGLDHLHPHRGTRRRQELSVACHRRQRRWVRRPRRDEGRQDRHKDDRGTRSQRKRTTTRRTSAREGPARAREGPVPPLRKSSIALGQLSSFPDRAGGGMTGAVCRWCGRPVPGIPS